MGVKIFLEKRAKVEDEENMKREPEDTGPGDGGHKEQTTGLEGITEADVRHILQRTTGDQ